MHKNMLVIYTRFMLIIYAHDIACYLCILFMYKIYACYFFKSVNAPKKYDFYIYDHYIKDP
jgi:hypothetical protein